MASFENKMNKALLAPKSKFNTPYGRLTSWIGTGKNAKHSIAFLVLIWVFIAGGITTIIVVFDCWYFSEESGHSQSIAIEIKLIWELVTPIVTLVLGYEFGRNEK